MRSPRKLICFFLITAVASLVLGHVSLVNAGSVDPYDPKGERFGIDSIVSWSFIDEALLLIGDLTYELLDIPVNTTKFSLPFYIAFDQGGKNDGRTIVGVPIGLGMQFNNYPIEVFIEAAPGIELAPDTEFDITGRIGVRFYFL